jgi:lysozyme family protein
MADIKLYSPLLWNLEGGFTNNPVDPGGATNHGITLNTYIEYCNKTNKPKPTVQDLKELTKTVWLDIVKTMYWDVWQADKINNQSVAEILVDWYFNSGIWGIRIPQRLLGLKEDGIVGNATISTINAMNQSELFNMIYNARKTFYINIVKNNPKQSIFLKGWMNRLAKFNFTMKLFNKYIDKDLVNNINRLSNFTYKI